MVTTSKRVAVALAVVVVILSGLDCKFVGGSGPGGGVAEIETADGVEGIFGSPGGEAAG